MFRFTIRDVLWLMVVVGLGAAWWGARAEAERLRYADRILHDLRAAVESEGYSSVYVGGGRRPARLIKLGTADPPKDAAPNSN